MSLSIVPSPHLLPARLAWQVPVGLSLIVLSIVAQGVRFELVGFLYLAVVTPELCRIDVAEHRLPNALVVPSFAFASVGIVFAWLAVGRPPSVAVISALATGGFFVVLTVAGGVGMGDLKLAIPIALVGGSLSVAVPIGTVVLGFIAAGFAALAMLLIQGAGGRIPFGPYLLGGFWASVALIPLID